MIIKVYREDGRPELSRWLIACDADACDIIVRLMGSRAWLVPEHPNMPVYCPACCDTYAAGLISAALPCPGCGLGDCLDFWHDPYSGSHICCWRCGAFLRLEDDPETGSGWFIP
jgi:hypothetical protein